MIEVTLEEMELPEDEVLEKLNLVSTARRVANLVSPPLAFSELAPLGRNVG